MPDWSYISIRHRYNAKQERRKEISTTLGKNHYPIDMMMILKSEISGTISALESDKIWVQSHYVCSDYLFVSIKSEIIESTEYYNLLGSLIIDKLKIERVEREREEDKKLKEETKRKNEEKTNENYIKDSLYAAYKFWMESDRKDIGLNDWCVLINNEIKNSVHLDEERLRKLMGLVK